MLLTREQKEQYKPEIERLLRQGYDPNFKLIPQYKVFVIFEDNKMIALAILNNPHGYWYFRNCVVDRKHRGRGLQRVLIQERLDYISEHGGGRVSVGIDPKNTKSLNNMLSMGFKFAKGGMKYKDSWYQKLYKIVD
jgi:GNAT superfamily N-acetyltransferase